MQTINIKYVLKRKTKNKECMEWPIYFIYYVPAVQFWNAKQLSKWCIKSFQALNKFL